MKETINYSRIEKAIKYLRENYQNQPSLNEVAQHIHLSKFHFQRLFETWAGVSPKSFIQFLTLEHAKILLREGKSTLHTAYDVGLSSQGRLHDLFVKVESLSPGEYKKMGKGVEIVYGFYPSLFGHILVAETEKGICHISFIDSKKEAVKDLRMLWKHASFKEGSGKYALQVQNFLSGSPSSHKNKILLNIKGSDFQIKVWEALLKIPKGQLCSYQDIAEMIGKPKASRAVGSAIANNAIAYIIPCHRVIKGNGEFGQYRWGETRKASIIGWESAQIERND